MFSTLPPSVRAEGWEAWEKTRMEREDQDARELPRETICDTSDSDCSCLSVNDSPRARRLKLDGLGYNISSSQVNNLRGIKRKAQKAAHNAHCRNKPKTSHLDDLVGDISAVLSWQTHQTREADGKFGGLGIH